MDLIARSLRNGLTSDALDRSSQYRTNANWIDQALDQSTSYIVPLSMDEHVFGKPKRTFLLSAPEVREAINREDLIYLGCNDNKHYFAISVIEDSVKRFKDHRESVIFVDGFEAALIAFAAGVCHWHKRTQFCGECGAKTNVRQAGHMRICLDAECGAVYFPRTDPAIIVLVHTGDHCLLGRKPEWEEKRHSTIAGFVEPGETVEQAVLREVKEETGIDVADLSYHSSQPWPFPGSVMLGFHAHAVTDQIVLIDGELEDARWFSRKDVSEAMINRGKLRLPPNVSIARRLINDWYNDDIS